MNLFISRCCFAEVPECKKHVLQVIVLKPIVRHRTRAALTGLIRELKQLRQRRHENVTKQ